VVVLISGLSNPLQSIEPGSTLTHIYPRASSDRYRAFIFIEREDNETDPLEYWNTRYSTQPDLARFTLDMLAILMMSAECERVFSSVKHLLTDARNRLNPDIIEANECLKHWFDKPKEQMDQEVHASVMLTQAAGESLESATYSRYRANRRGA
jgi:hypothetical protein